MQLINYSTVDNFSCEFFGGMLGIEPGILSEKQLPLCYTAHHTRESFVVSQTLGEVAN